MNREKIIRVKEREMKRKAKTVQTSREEKLAQFLFNFFTVFNDDKNKE